MAPSNLYAMKQQDFAHRFEEFYRLTYKYAVRRIADKRERLSPETLALLMHMSMTGPLSMGELSQHLSRAPSTVSEIVQHLIAKNFAEKDRDPKDGRRSLIWLTPQGQKALQSSQQVLDLRHLEKAGKRLSDAQREELLKLFENFTNHLKEKPYE